MQHTFRAGSILSRALIGTGEVPYNWLYLRGSSKEVLYTFQGGQSYSEQGIEPTPGWDAYGVETLWLYRRQDLELEVGSQKHIIISTRKIQILREPPPPRASSACAGLTDVGGFPFKKKSFDFMEKH